MGKSKVETGPYLAMVGRVVRSAGQRVGGADLDEFVALVDLRNTVDDAIAEAVGGLRANGGYSYRAIGRAIGVTGEAVYMRWGKRLARMAAEGAGE